MEKLKVFAWRLFLSGLGLVAFSVYYKSLMDFPQELLVIIILVVLVVAFWKGIKN